MSDHLIRPIRVYADTSVYGGVFDRQFSQASKGFFDKIADGRFLLVVSPVISEEIRQAPQRVRDLFDQFRGGAEPADVSADAIALQAAYMRAGIVGPNWEADALHVALATVSRCPMIVSWNFKHIVHFQKIPLYNGVNISLGHGPIGIYTPLEVIADEE
jgi:hypothetical protein